MNRQIEFIALIGLLAFLYSPAGYSQDGEPAATLPKETSDKKTAEEQEVEINEDNYRQFMELRDARQQRNVLPENAFQPRSGSQKLDKLPESSQKHLRNQLREIIVQGDRWQPGDEGTVYPYVPSEAASTDQALQAQEAEAWGELVNSYNKREAEIYAHASQSQAAKAAGNMPGGEGNRKGSNGGEQGEGEPGQRTSQQNDSEQSSATDAYSPGALSDPNARNTAGVSQNAMEFLQGKLNHNGNGGDSSDGYPTGDGGQEESRTQAPSGQQPGSEQSPAVVQNPGSQTTAGSSQNAMEFLQGMDNQGDKTGESGNGSPGSSDEEGQEQTPGYAQISQEGPSDEGIPGGTSSSGTTQESNTQSMEGSSQNAMEFLAGNGNQGSSPIENNIDIAGNQDGNDESMAQAGNRDGNEQEPSASNSPGNSTEISPTGPEVGADATSGASQNAQDYLMEGESQVGQSTSNESQTSDQNDESPPLPELPSLSEVDAESTTQPNSGPPGQESTAGSPGTLSIQDLLNAQGVGNTTASGPAPGSGNGQDEVDPEPDDPGPDDPVNDEPGKD